MRDCSMPPAYSSTYSEGSESIIALGYDRILAERLATKIVQVVENMYSSKG